MRDVTIAVDCDLHSVSAWCSVCGAVCNQSDNYMDVIHHVTEHEVRMAIDNPPLVIFEIAAPNSVVGEHRVGGNAKLYHLARWMLFNIHVATRFASQLDGGMFHVAPSGVWTKGFNESVRQKMAGVQTKYTGTKKPIGHDLRECQAMLWFHSHDPHKWITLDEFIENLGAGHVKPVATAEKVAAAKPSPRERPSGPAAR